MLKVFISSIIVSFIHSFNCINNIYIAGFIILLTFLIITKQHRANITKFYRHGADVPLFSPLHNEIPTIRIKKKVDNQLTGFPSSCSDGKTVNYRPIFSRLFRTVSVKRAKISSVEVKSLRNSASVRAVMHDLTIIELDGPANNSNEKKIFSYYPKSQSLRIMHRPYSLDNNNKSFLEDQSMK